MRRDSRKLFFVLCDDPHTELLIRAESALDARESGNQGIACNVVPATIEGAQRWVNGEPFNISMRGEST